MYLLKENCYLYLKKPLLVHALIITQCAKKSVKEKIWAGGDFAQVRLKKSKTKKI